MCYLDGMTDGEPVKAEKDLAAAQGAVAAARATCNGVQTRITEAGRAIEAADKKLLAGNVDDPKSLAKLAGERDALSATLEVLRRATLPKAEEVLAGVMRRQLEAEKVRDAAATDGLLARFHGEAAKLLEVACRAVEQLKALAEEHRETGDALAGVGFDPGDSPWIRIARFLRSRDYAAALGDVGRLTLAAEVAAGEPSPEALEAARLDRERRNAVAIRLYEQNHGAEAQARAAQGRARAAQGLPLPQPPGPPRPTGEPTWSDRR